MAEKIGLEAVLDMTKFDRGMGQYMRGIGQMESKTGGIAGKLGGLGKAAVGVGIKAAAGVAAAGAGLAVGMGAIIKTGVDAARDFESQIAILSTAADGADASLADLKATALAVGADTSLVGVSASQAADAMTGLYKAGLTTNDIFGDMQGYLAGTTELSGALRAAVDLQAASSLDLAGASDIVAVAMATFGLSADEAITISDNFVQAADASVAEVEDLAAAMKNVGPTAAQFGWSLEDTNNALAILSTRGITGSEAGTALKSMMTNLMRPTDKTQEMLNELGISLYDANGEMLSMPTIIGKLQKSMAGLTEEEKNVAIQTLAGTYGMKAMAVFLDEGVEGWDAMADATANAASAQEVAAARTNTLEGAMEAFDGVMETLKISIGDAFLPLITDMVRKFAEFVSTHGPQITAIFQTIADWIGTYVPLAIQYLADLWGGTLFPILQDWWAFLQANVVPILQDVARWLGENLPIAVQKLSDFWTSTLYPALIQVGQFVVGTVIPALKDLWAWLQTNLPIAIQTLSDFWTTTLQPALETAWNFIQTSVIPALMELWDWLQTNLPIAIQTLSDFWTNTLQPALEEGYRIFSEDILPVLQEVWAWLQENLPTAIDVVAGFLVDTLIPAWLDIWDVILNKILPVFQDIWNFLNTNIVPIMGALLDVLLAIIEKGFEVFAALWTNVLQPAFQELSQWLNENVNPALEDLKGWLDDVLPGFEGVGGAVEKVVDWLGDLAEKIRNLELPDWLDPGSPTPFQLALEAIGGVFQGALLKAMTAFSEALLPAIALWQEGFTTWTDQFIALYETHIPTLQDVFSECADAIKEYLDDIIKLTEDWKKLLEEITNTTLPALQAMAVKVFTAIMKVIDETIKKTDALKSAIDAVKSAAEAMGSAFVSWLVKVQQEIDITIWKMEALEYAARKAAYWADRARGEPAEPPGEPPPNNYDPGDAPEPPSPRIPPGADSLYYGAYSAPQYATAPITPAQQIALTFNTTIASGMDQAVFEARVTQVVRDALR